MAFARKYLVWEGLLDGSKHGVWVLTPKGAKTFLTTEQENAIVKKWVAYWTKLRKEKEVASQNAPDSKLDSVDVVSSDEDEELDLLTVLRSLSPGGFEKVCQRLLRVHGFERVVVTGGPHDWGIDGTGILQINAFVSFKVLFQCKRYKGTVPRRDVGDFRNAMIGRADKGIIITTGTFSADARAEAERPGAPPVELVDGEKLVTMFESKGLGVKPKTGFDIDLEFFEQFRETPENSTQL
ncbi:MAG: restriction endonuclease [Verrucomicrobia bacterium]|nr:restriction endonuclease [Verrucomicrobiota bacterium]